MTTNHELGAAIAPTGLLRAAINLGNPVLTRGTVDAPAGVTVELARALADALGLAARLTCFTAARDSFAAVATGTADVGFLAVDPTRAEQVSFTRPYTVIDGVYVVRDDSPIRTAAEVDRAGVRVGVKRGSAYDLFLTRTLQHAELVRGEEGVDVYRDGGLEVGAGIRQAVDRFAAAHPGHRVITERFMQIDQAVALPRDRPPAALAFVDAFVEARRADGSIGKWLAGSA